MHSSLTCRGQHRSFVAAFHSARVRVLRIVYPEPVRVVPTNTPHLQANYGGKLRRTDHWCLRGVRSIERGLRSVTGWLSPDAAGHGVGSDIIHTDLLQGGYWSLCSTKILIASSASYIISEKKYLRLGVKCRIGRYIRYPGHTNATR